MAGTPHHILTVTVENKPGVLSRVAGLFSRRAFNIFSLAVSPTDDERFSRMTVVVDAETAPLEQVVKQLNKLIPVIKITEIAPGDGPAGGQPAPSRSDRCAAARRCRTASPGR